jgi:hypothetical protein
MPIELTCLIMLIANAILVMLIIMLVKKFKVKNLKNYIRQLEKEKLEDNEEILKLQYEISFVSEKQELTSLMPVRFEVMNMN